MLRFTPFPVECLLTKILYMLNDWDLGHRKAPHHMLVCKCSGLFVSD